MIEEQVCRLCGAADTERVGPIVHPARPTVAGAPIDLGTAAYELRRCRQCGFQFKFPEVDAGRLMACYAGASAVQWEEMPDPHQRRFDDLRRELERRQPSGRLLDIGCFNGALQSYLGPAWTHFGVEPSQAAAAMATARGTTILAETVEAISRDVEPFDVIIAVDLIEHLPEPMPTFRRIAELLAPGGIAVFVTGDTDAASWRRVGSRYWYCALPEHVGFFNRRSLKYVADSCALTPVAHVPTSHIRGRPDKRLRQWLRNWMFGLALRTPGIGSSMADEKPPRCQTLADHMLHIMRREA